MMDSRWLDKEEFKAKMECLNWLKYNKLKNISEKERRYEIATISSDYGNSIDYITHRNYLIKTYGLK